MQPIPLGRCCAALAAATFVLIATHVSAQEGAAPAPAAPVVSNPPPAVLSTNTAATNRFVKESGRLRDELTDEPGYWVRTIVGAIISLISLALGCYVRAYIDRRAYSPKRVRPGQRKNTVLVVGLGRTGKSELIAAITENVVKAKDLTTKFSITSCSKRDDSSLIHYHFTDYRGQSFSQLISNFVKEQFHRHTIVRYGDINTLILVVDIFPFKEDEPPKKTYPDYSTERITEHLQEWNHTALDAVMGLLTQDQLNYVCLYINKVDKWAGSGSADSEEVLRKEFASLIEDLTTRVSDFAQFDVIAGSALRGTGISGRDGLQSQLSRYSVPLVETTDA